MRVRSSSRFSREISDAWSANDGNGDKPGDDVVARDRALPPRTIARQFRSIDGEMPTSVATCISERPLLSSRATVSRLNSGENSLLVFGIVHLHAQRGLAKVSAKSRDHQFDSQLSGSQHESELYVRQECTNREQENRRSDQRRLTDPSIRTWLSAA